MDSGNRHDDEVDLFEPAGTQSGSLSSEEHIETETNVFSVDTLRRAAALHGGTDTGSFEVSSPKHAAGGSDAVDFEPAAENPVIDTSDDTDDTLDYDFSQKKSGFFTKLFRLGTRDKEDDPNDLSLDDNLFIAPPPASGRTSAPGANTPPAAAAVTDSSVFELGPPANKAVAETVDEPAPVTTVPEVTDSGVFEFKPSTDNFVSDTVDKPTSSVTAATEVTDSGVFELGPSTDEPVSETADEPASVTTATEVTDSGVFELGPSTDEPVSETADEPAPVTAATEVTDSGVFELGPSTDEPVSETADEPAPVTAATEVTDSGVFELGPSAAPPPHDAAKGGDEWEIGWEPEEEGAAADFDVSGAAPVQAAAETPPPVFTKLAHVCLYVKDLGRSVEFYTKLGFRKRFVFNRNGNLFGAYLEFGDGNFIELFEDISRSATAALGRLAHFCLETPDIDAAMESLSARGIGFSPKKLGSDSTYQIWLKDPDGNEFEVHQYTPESSQIVGGEVEADW